MNKINGGIPLYFWNRVNNFGDQMSKDILEYFLTTKIVRVDETFEGKFLAIGSILDKCMPGDVIWGSGVHPRFYRETGDYNYLPLILSKIGRKTYSASSFLAVRGPITRQYLIQNDGPDVDVFGDPAILAPIVYPRVRNPKRRHLLINHFSVPSHNETSVAVVSASNDWRSIVDAVCESEVVISSSLHGLILAEAYGVPAIFMHNSKEGLIKYIDYYGASQRFPMIVNSVDEAFAKKSIPEPPIFSEIAKNLVAVLNGWKVGGIK